MRTHYPRRKVLFIGWDAADWKVVMPLVDAGKMPTAEEEAAADAHGPADRAVAEAEKEQYERGANANDSQTLYNRSLVGWDNDECEHIELLLEFGLGQGDGGVWHDRTRDVR